jgi:hypothetical protein
LKIFASFNFLNILFPNMASYQKIFVSYLKELYFIAAKNM